MAWDLQKEIKRPGVNGALLVTSTLVETGLVLAIAASSLVDQSVAATLLETCCLVDKTRIRTENLSGWLEKPTWG